MAVLSFRRQIAPEAASAPESPAGGALVASVGAPPSADLLRLAAAWLTAARVRRVLLLYVREVPGTLPLGAWPLEEATMAPLRAFVERMRRRGIQASLEVADVRDGPRALAERARLLAARAVLLHAPRGPDGRQARRANHALRRLRGVSVILLCD